jgi:hypothetical protein
VDSCSHVPSCQTLSAAASRGPSARNAYPLPNSGVLTGCLGLALGQGGRRDRQTGDEILPAHVYHKEGERRRGLLPGLVPFRLVAPSLQP